MKNHFRIGLLFLIALALGVSACAKKQIVAPEPEQTAVEQEAQITVEDIKFTDEPSVRDAVVEQKTALETVYFNLDSSSLDDAGMNTLKNNEEYLKANPNINVVVEGHCDERGTTEYNLALGQRRALKVKEYYVQLGIAPNRIATISYGEEMPAVKMNNESAWAKNRRAETKILTK